LSSLNLLRESEILIRNTALAVRGERDENAVVPNIDVGMMVGGVRQIGDAIHKRHRGAKVREGEFLADLIVLPAPICKS